MNERNQYILNQIKEEKSRQKDIRQKYIRQLINEKSPSVFCFEPQFIASGLILVQPEDLFDYLRENLKENKEVENELRMMFRQIYLPLFTDDWIQTTIEGKLMFPWVTEGFNVFDELMRYSCSTSLNNFHVFKRFCARHSIPLNTLSGHYVDPNNALSYAEIANKPEIMIEAIQAGCVWIPNDNVIWPCISRGFWKVLGIRIASGRLVPEPCYNRLQTWLTISDLPYKVRLVVNQLLQLMGPPQVLETTNNNNIETYSIVYNLCLQAGSNHILNEVLVSKSLSYCICSTLTKGEKKTDKNGCFALFIWKHRVSDPRLLILIASFAIMDWRSVYLGFIDINETN